MIVDYGPLPGSIFDDIMKWLIAAIIVDFLYLLVRSMSRHQDEMSKVDSVALITLPLLFVAGIVFGANSGREHDEIRDREYPILLEQAGYTDLQRVDNGEYAAISPDEELVVVEVEPVEGHPDKFTVLEVVR